MVKENKVKNNKNRKSSKKNKEIKNKNNEKIFVVKEITESDYVGPEKWKFKLTLNWIFIPLLVLSFTFNIWQFFDHVGFLKFWEVFFLDEKNKFQWAGVTAVVAIISLVVTVIFTRGRNKADLVSKSRIEWIQKVKKIMSTYLADVHYYPYAYIKLKDLEKQRDSIFLSLGLKNKEIKLREANLLYDQQKEYVDNLLRKIEETQYLLLVNLSDNYDNTQINQCIVDCALWTNNFKVQYELARNTVQWNSTHVTNLLKVSRDYFKREWDKAKKGK